MQSVLRGDGGGGNEVLAALPLDGALDTQARALPLEDPESLASHCRELSILREGLRPPRPVNQRTTSLRIPLLLFRTNLPHPQAATVAFCQRDFSLLPHSMSTMQVRPLSSATERWTQLFSQHPIHDGVLSVVGSRRGLYSFPVCPRVASGAVSTPLVEHPRYDMGDLAELIVSHMPTPSLVSLQSPRSDDAVSAARDLFNVMRASSSFFYPAAEALWSSCADINNLLWVLYGSLGWDNTTPRLHEAERDLEKEIIAHL